ncbi:MAG: 3-deoxy-manno-octulosonate cytidylyltransferase [Planctomycetota bacterium]|nr:MAG: 3-deoxy-manno-octulosonate cytidylyltransferase [Planctomycetota bacterium]
MPAEAALGAVAVIPARFASTRLPGKPLLAETGRPLIQHVWEQVRRAVTIGRVIIATDHDGIASAARDFGAEVAMTRDDHVSGTDRVAEVAAGLNEAYVLNVQGDEPEVDPGDLDRLVRRLATGAEPLVTLARPLGPDEGRLLADPNAVKVVLDDADRALYFSRSPIPHGTDPVGAWLHLGVYAYRREALLEFAAAPPAALERRERLEQLRALARGTAIGVVRTSQHALGIDTPDDYARFVERFGARPSPPGTS